MRYAACDFLCGNAYRIGVSFHAACGAFFHSAAELQGVHISLSLNVAQCFISNERRKLGCSYHGVEIINCSVGKGLRKEGRGGGVGVKYRKELTAKLFLFLFTLNKFYYTVIKHGMIISYVTIKTFKGTKMVFKPRFCMLI